jgi:hypothetical protein
MLLDLLLHPLLPPTVGVAAAPVLLLLLLCQVCASG